jgi:hypothetical protein
MRHPIALVVVIALTPVARGQSADPEGDPDLPASAHASVYGEVLAERFVACLHDEGRPPTLDDRAVLSDMAVALGPSVARRLGGEGCDDSVASQAACAAQVRELSCEQLATRLTPGAVAAPPPPPWALGHARSVARRVGACAVQEHDGGALDDDERRALTDFEAGLAAALGALYATGACVVDENALPACAQSVGAVRCDGLGARLGDDPAALARTVTRECAAMIRCGTAALDDGDGGEPDAAPDDATVEDAP